jgi:hypothetical protein
MLDLPPLAQTIVFAFLVIGYIVTFYFQKNKISVLEKTNSALKELTDGQKNHIDTYKQMVNLTELDQHYSRKIEGERKIVFETVAKMVSDEGGPEPFIKNWYNKMLSEYTSFFVIIAGNSDTLDLQFLKTNFPKNYPILEELLRNYKPNIEIQKLLKEEGGA